jgi:hypothetical protein
MIIIIMRGENFVAHLDGLGGTPVAHHYSMETRKEYRILAKKLLGNPRGIQEIYIKMDLR